MNTLLLALAMWGAVSLPAGMFLGRVIALGEQER